MRELVEGLGRGIELPEGLAGTIPFALAGRVTLVLGLALALSWLTRRSAASTRHQLWTVTFALLLALPFLTGFGPSWELPFLPASAAPAAGPVEEAPQFEALRRAAGGEFSPAARARETAAVAAETTASAAAPSAPWLPTALLLAWGLGCAAALASTAVGIGRFRRLVRAAHPVSDPAWLESLAALRERLGVRAQVRLLVGKEAPTPMAGGLRRPVILLPASAAAWRPARLAVVLAHELVHVRRRDAFRQVAARLALALYWFHPLSWVASRQAAASSEEACDEAVLLAGARPSEYARHLLALAEDMADDLGRGPAVVALPIVHRSQLERRIRAIVKPGRPQRRKLVTVLASLALGVGAISVSTARPVSVAPVSVEQTGQGLPREDLLREAAADSTMAAQRDCEVHELDGQRADVHFKADPDGLLLCVGLAGDARVSENGGEPLAVAPNGWLVLESVDERRHRLVITGGADGSEYAWSIDGNARTYDADAREWLGLVLALIDAYMKQGGISAPWQVEGASPVHDRGGVEEWRREMARFVQSEQEELRRLDRVLTRKSLGDSR